MSLTVLATASVVLAGSASVITLLLRRHATRGGAKEGAAAEIAGQALAWSDAFRGASSREHPAWDGHSVQLAPPQEHF